MVKRVSDEEEKTYKVEMAVQITPEFLMEILKPGRRYESLKGAVPEEAEFRRAYYDPESLSLVFGFEGTEEEISDITMYDPLLQDGGRPEGCPSPISIIVTSIEPGRGEIHKKPAEPLRIRSDSTMFVEGTLYSEHIFEGNVEASNLFMSSNLIVTGDLIAPKEPTPIPNASLSFGSEEE